MVERGAGDETARLCALQRYEVLDTAPEEAFDRITRLAKAMLDIPIVLVSLVDKDRQWFKSRQGTSLDETSRQISFCTHAIEGTDTFIVEDARADPRFAASPLVVQEPFIRFYAGVPLRTNGGHNIGTLCAMDTEVRELTSRQIRMLEDLARLVIDELELRLLATTDGLTGLMTRRAFDEHANLDAERCKRYHKPLSCAAIDIDNFKIVNDSFGHAAGDLVLRQVAAICKSGLRAADYIGRVGGDELLAMLPETTLIDALQIAERLRKGIETASIEIAGQPIRVSVSIGVAEFRLAGTLARLLQDADEALYDAKLDGRNRVVCHFDDLRVIPREQADGLAPNEFGRVVNLRRA
jgi:diguanylate cyclase (GGDEF)-like protein